MITDTKSHKIKNAPNPGTYLSLLSKMARTEGGSLNTIGSLTKLIEGLRQLGIQNEYGTITYQFNVNSICV